MSSHTDSNADTNHITGGMDISAPMRHPEVLKNIFYQALEKHALNKAWILRSDIFKDELTLQVVPEALYKIIHLLKTEPTLAFSQLIDICGVDYAAYGIAEWDVEASSIGFSRGVDESSVGRSNNALQRVKANSALENRFSVVYHFLSLTHNARIRLKVFLASQEMLLLDSIVNLYTSANWYEREVFDLFGILFSGHPDLRRILTDYGFVGHPLRKDFPLVGHVEMIYDEVLERVIYQPVSIESRVNIPRTIRASDDQSASYLPTPKTLRSL